MRENGIDERGLWILEEANGSEIVYVQEEPVRNLLQTGIVQLPENGLSCRENVERWLGGVNANGAQR